MIPCPLSDENLGQTGALQGKNGLICCWLEGHPYSCAWAGGGALRITPWAISVLSALGKWLSAQLWSVQMGWNPHIPGRAAKCRQWQCGDQSNPTQAACSDGDVPKSTLGWLFVQPERLTDVLLSRLAFKIKLLCVNADVRKDVRKEVSPWTHERGKHICEMQI